MIEVRVRPEATADIDHAMEYYEAQQYGLGLRFRAHVQDEFSRIEENPVQFPFVDEPIRRVVLQTFPYGIYYIAEDEGPVVVAVYAFKDDPEKLAARLKSAV